MGSTVSYFLAQPGRVFLAASNSLHVAFVNDEPAYASIPGAASEAGAIFSFHSPS
jgi:hypothetical protein